MKLLPATSHRVMPWKNGGGTTTEIARFASDTADTAERASLDDFAWRVSLARIEAAGPFSRFDGIDRSIAVVTGAGMTLELDGRGEVSLDERSAPFAFPGEARVSATLREGATEDFNAMTRRGTFRHWVTRVRPRGPARYVAQGDAAVLFVARGAFDTLGARDAALLEGAEGIDLAPRGDAGDAELFVVDLWRV
jgi:environmental stress-induced protein Ves